MNEKKMEAKIVDLRDLFQAQISYQIPQFQRPYAWEEDVQWRPLWEDVCIVAERFLNKEDDEKVRSHFMGAIVLQQQQNIIMAFTLPFYGLITKEVTTFTQCPSRK